MKLVAFITRLSILMMFSQAFQKFSYFSTFTSLKLIILITMTYDMQI